MIVVDRSVWIAQRRGPLSPAVRRLRAIVADDDDQVLVGDLILLEVLQGARDQAHAVRIEQDLRRFPIVPMLDAGVAVQAARNDRSLRTRGVTVRRTIDRIIGSFCRTGGHALRLDGRGFDPMAAHLGLLVVPV